MSVYSTDNSIIKECAKLKDFEFGFKIFKAEDLKVYLAEKAQVLIPLVLNRDYTIEINRIEDGGTITLTETHEGYSLYAVRDIEIIQPEEIPTEGYFPEKTLEDALDRGTMIDQQLQSQINGCLKVSDYVKTEGVKVELPAPEPNKAIGWNSKGDGLANIDIGEKADSILKQLQEYSTQFSGLDKKISDMKKDVDTATDNINTKVNDALSSHFIGEFLQSSVPYTDEHIAPADGREIDVNENNTVSTNLFNYLRGLRDKSNRTVTKYKIHGNGSHIDFYTDMKPVKNGDETLIRLGLLNTLVMPADVLGDIQARLTYKGGFNLYSYRRYKELSTEGDIATPNYLTTLLNVDDDNSAGWTLKGLNVTADVADTFYSIAMGSDIVTATDSKKVSHTTFNGVTYLTSDVTIDTVCATRIAYKKLDVTSVEKTDHDNRPAYKVTFADGAIAYYDQTPDEPLQVVYDIDLPYYNYCDVVSGYAWEGSISYVYNENFLTDWERYRYASGMRDNDHEKFYIGEKSKSSINFYDGYKANYTDDDITTYTTGNATVRVETVTGDVVPVTTTKGITSTARTLGLDTNGALGNLQAGKTVRFCSDTNAPNNATASTIKPLGDVYFEFVTPYQITRNTYIFNAERALMIYFNTDSKGRMRVFVSGGGYYSNKTWHWRVNGMSTGISLDVNTRYSFDFKVTPNEKGEPQTWNLTITNMNSGTANTWHVNTKYYPYNYQNKYGMRTIGALGTFACGRKTINKVSVDLGGVLDLSTLVIKGQDHEYRAIEPYKDTVVTYDKDFVTIPKISDKGSVHTYVVLNGVKTVNSAYTIDTDRFVLKTDVYNKEESDKIFATKGELPDLSGYATHDDLAKLSDTIEDTYALKSQLHTDLSEFTNEPAEGSPYATIEDITTVINSRLSNDDIEKLRSISDYDDTKIKQDIAELKADVESLTSQKADEGDLTTVTYTDETQTLNINTKQEDNAEDTEDTEEQEES